MRFPDGRVVLVTHPVVQSYVRTDFPFILRISDVELQLSQTVSNDAVIEGAWIAHVAEVLDGSRFVGQKICQVIEHVGTAAEPVRIETVESNLTPELEGVLALRPDEIIDEVQRVGRVRLAATIRGRVGADEATRNSSTGRCSLTRDAEVGGISGNVDGKFAEARPRQSRTPMRRKTKGSP